MNSSNTEIDFSTLNNSSISSQNQSVSWGNYTETQSSNYSPIIDKPKKKAGALRITCTIFGVVGLVLLICCLCSFGVVYLSVNQALKNVSTKTYELLCENKSTNDLKMLYEGTTTRKYRKDVSFENFEDQVSLLKDSKACEKLKHQGVWEIVLNFASNGGENFTSEVDENGNYILKIKIEDRIIRLDLEASGTDANGDTKYLIDFFEVEKAE